MTTIHLPLGGFIQTDGIEYKSGAYVHIHNQEGEMTYRAIRQEFQNKPQETMKNFLDELAELIPNASQTEGKYLFHFPDCSLKGSPQIVGIYDRSHSKTPILEYTFSEWEENPEEVIGALLNCLEIETNPRREESEWEGESDHL